ncbi:MAG: TonB-dependent receptor [Thiobacillus sp.]
MSQQQAQPPSGILRQLLARIQPVAAAPAAASLAFMMLAPAALAQNAPDATTLPAVKVEDTADPMAVNNGYQATETRVGKTKQDPHDIPQAITTVTNQLMEEQQVGSLREALRNVSGLTFNAAEGGRSGDNMMLRGFYTFGDLYLDGIRDTAQYNRETFNLEQIDVLRGSASMLFGRGQAGGVINMVSKVPKRADAYKLTGSIGTDDYYEATADLNKRIGQDSALRVNLMKRDEGSWRENPATGTEADFDRRGAAISLGLGLNTDDELILSHILSQTRDNPDYGLRFDAATREPTTLVPASTFYNIDANFDDSDTNVSTATYTHRFSPKSEWRTQLRYGDYERSYWAKTMPNGATASNPATMPSATGGVGGNQVRSMDYETLTLQSDFSNSFRALGMKHELVTGIEYLHEDSHRKGLQNFGTTANPDYRPYQEATTGNPVDFTGDSYAAYVQDTVEFMPFWKLTLGLRRDELRADYASLTSPKLSYGEWSTRAGLSYQPTDTTHYYASYSDSFSPTADLYQISGGELPPERSKVYEAGAKWMFFDGDLAFRSALYRAEKEWERNTDLESTAALLSRERHTNGLEFEIAGRINEHWEIFGGIALMDAKIDDQYDGVPLGSFATLTNNGTAAGPTGLAGAGYAPGEAADAGETVYRTRSQQTSEGERPRNTPKYTLNLWSTYKFSPGWKAGLGFETKGDRYGYGVGTCGAATQATTGANAGMWSYGNCSTAAFAPNVAPSYVRWDAMVAYEQQAWAVRLNVRNLFDKLYYDALYDNGGFTVPGTNRRFLLTGELKF